VKLTKQETEFVKAQGVARLATVNGEGVPHNVPVCPILDRGKLYLGTETGAQKVKNMKTNPRAAIVFDMYRVSWNGLRGVMLQCRARIIDQKEFRKIRGKIYAKYPKYESEAPLEPGESVVVELTPQKKFTWGF
jgi:nitroimidazol reductase NimA-like FMN-containing flavoprotein (pyridoxamine 5'-phosphate oxidase superfamily)